MSNLIVTPEIIRRVDSNLRNIYTDAWVRRLQNLWWKRLVKTRTSSTKTELLMWMLDTARIRSLGEAGSEKTFEDLVEIYWEITNDTTGSNLSLNVDEISDALGGTAAQGSPLDRAARWAKHVGNAGAYWPQKQATYLLKNGKTLLCYDGQPFFSASHPVNAYTGGGGTFANLLTGYPFSATNLARVTAYVQSIVAPDGDTRNLMPSVVAAGPDLRFGVTQALSAEWFTDPKNSGGNAAGSNIIKTSYGFQEPVIASELNEPGVWYLACELVEDDELGGLIYQEREAYSLTSYSNMTDPELGRRNDLEWQQKGRNASSYGHPFLLFRIEGAGSESPVLPAL